MALSEIDILRRDAGDINRESPYLTDEDYEQLITTIPNKRKLRKHIDLLILGIKQEFIHERSGQEEMWGNQLFEQGVTLLKLKWKDSTFAGYTAMPSFGGTSKEEMLELATDPDRVPDTFYKGEGFGKAEWQSTRKYTYCGDNLEPFRTKMPFYG